MVRTYGKDKGQDTIKMDLASKKYYKTNQKDHKKNWNKVTTENLINSGKPGHMENKTSSRKLHMFSYTT